MKIFLSILTLTLGLFAGNQALAQSANSGVCVDAYACVASIQQNIKLDYKLEALPQYASLPSRFQTNGERTFVFSPKEREWGAYDADGYQVAGGQANGGADMCNDIGRPCRTPVGAFRISRRGDSSCVSSKYPLGEGGAPMPYCMFFKGGNAIHGSPYISNRNGSHGCIRVRTKAAAWLSRYFMRNGTKVVVLPY